MPEIIDIRSIRQFTPEPLERETLILLRKATMAAPTACNSQPWEFVGVTEPDVLAQIRDKFCLPDITRRLRLLYVATWVSHIIPRRESTSGLILFSILPNCSVTTRIGKSKSESFDTITASS